MAVTSMNFNIALECALKILLKDTITFILILQDYLVSIKYLIESEIYVVVVNCATPRKSIHVQTLYILILHEVCFSQIL